jgi:DNA-binding transcriptional MerR regulator
MQIGELAARLGTSPHAIRFYERRGLLPAAARTPSGYRDYSEEAAERLRLLIGLRRVDLPLDQAAELAGLCAEGRCEEVSDELRVAIADKRREVARRAAELRFLDRRLAHLSGQLARGDPPRTLIRTGKEDVDDRPL